jgi:hypothetical protein
MRWASVTTWAAGMNRPGATEKAVPKKSGRAIWPRLLSLDGNDGEHRPQDVDISGKRARVRARNSGCDE